MSSHTNLHSVSDPPPWYEKYTPSTNKIFKHNKNNLVTVTINNRLVIGESLPVISVSNMRSLGPKLESLKTDIIEREISVALISEIWEKVGCKKQSHEIEKMFQLRWT